MAVAIGILILAGCKGGAGFNRKKIATARCARSIIAVIVFIGGFAVIVTARLPDASAKTPGRVTPARRRLLRRT